MQRQTIAIGADHGGYMLKETVKKHLLEQGYTVEDLGTNGLESVNYPDYSRKVAEHVLENGSMGILVCGTGIGMSMAANRIPGIRAGLCTDEYMARKTRQHNNANILCLGERCIGSGLALSIVDAYLSTEFEGGRHKQRIDMFDAK